MEVMNIFIVVLLIGAAWLGVAALVQKKTHQRQADPERDVRTPS